MPLAVKHHPEACRFEARPEGHLALCSYRRVAGPQGEQGAQGDTLVLHHTEVPAALQGRGVAGALVQATLDWARAQGLRVRPTCSYVAAYMRRHPETQDLLEHPGDLS